MTYQAPRPGQCLYIEPYPLTSMTRCEHDHAAGDQYCAAHRSKMGQRGTSLRKRHKDIARANHIWDLESEFNTVLEEIEAEEG